MDVQDSVLADETRDSVVTNIITGVLVSKPDGYETRPDGGANSDILKNLKLNDQELTHSFGCFAPTISIK